MRFVSDELSFESARLVLLERAALGEEDEEVIRVISVRKAERRRKEGNMRRI
jgi:uncharacterized DUF497 family protein